MIFGFGESVANVTPKLFGRFLFVILRSKMILNFFLIFHAVFALNSENQLSKRDSGTFLDHQNKNASFLEPRFNENCDEISLEAASECEGEFKISEYFNILLIYCV